MNRRTFLGAAAALANLPAPSSSDGAGGRRWEDEEQLKNYYDELQSPAQWGWADLGGEEQAEVEISVASMGTYDDDAEEWRADIALGMGFPSLRVCAYLTPEQADALADALRRGRSRRFKAELGP